jgi:Uncharacterized membrane protein
MDNPWVIAPWDLVLRLLAAMVFGGLIGLEREQSNHAAGFRTHILVCLGSALIMLLSIYGFEAFVDEPNVRIDPARMAAQVVAGIGFLGAGVILFNGVSIKGLTTAASLWVVAAIGLAVGAGFYLAAVVTTILALFSLFVLNIVEHRWLNVKKESRITVTVANSEGIIPKIYEAVERCGIDPGGVSVRLQKLDGTPNGGGRVEIVCRLRKDRQSLLPELLGNLGSMEHVQEVRSR